MSSCRLGAAALIGAAVACLSCGPAEPGARPGYFGRWEVIGFDMPGFHTLSAEESEALVGTEAFFSGDQARFRDRGCRPPAYDEREVDPVEFGSEYGVDPALLDLAVPVQLVDVGCAAAWTGPGSLLVLRADGSMLTVWEGVFFELARVDP